MKLSNHIVISAVLVIALVALTGVASAATPAITHVQVHGNYHGVPTITGNSVVGYWGYNYQMVPTGYTVTYTNETGVANTFEVKSSDVPNGVGDIRIPDTDFGVTDGTVIENDADTKLHTINLGPMSNTVAIFANGKLTFSDESYNFNWLDSIIYGL